MKKPIPFGKYLLLERINVGGMAEVFLAKPLATPGFDSLLAIKKILPTMVEDEEFITMFLDEARISVQLNHPNVVQIHGLGKQDENFYIAMDYVAGKDMRTLVERYRRRKEIMPTVMAVFLGIKMAEGLDYAHRKKDAAGADLNIVHRDVSPQNILVSYAGEVKIIDFGIAKAANRAQKTQAGILKGKFGYMSPEQVRGLPIDRRSDIFALGVVLFEMLTGEKLFVGESDFSTLEKVRNAEVPSPRQYNGNIPPALEKVMYKALAREVEDRYQWGSELADDLTRFLNSGDSPYGARQLSSFMTEAFAEDVMREKKRIDAFAAMDLPKPPPEEAAEVSGTSPTAQRLPRFATPPKQPTPVGPDLPGPRPVGRSGAQPIVSSRGNLRAAAPAPVPIPIGRRATGGAGSPALDPVAAALAELDGPTFIPNSMKVPADLQDEPPEPEPVKPAPKPGKASKPSPAIGDPHNPYIPPPSAEEMAEMGTSDRTEIFKPAFQGGAVGLEAPNGKIAPLARDTTDSIDEHPTTEGEGQSNATMIGRSNSFDPPPDENGATLMMNGHTAQPDPDDEPDPMTLPPTANGRKSPGVMSMGKMKSAPAPVVAKPPPDRAETRAKPPSRTPNPDTGPRFEAIAEEPTSQRSQATDPAPKARGGRGPVAPPPDVEPEGWSEEQQQQEDGQDEQPDPTGQIPPAKKPGGGKVLLIIGGTAMGVVLLACAGWFGYLAFRKLMGPGEGAVIITVDPPDAPASVLVDGQPAKLREKVTVAPGAHQITLRVPGQGDQVAPVTVEKGGIQPVSFKLEVAKAPDAKPPDTAPAPDGTKPEAPKPDGTTATAPDKTPPTTPEAPKAESKTFTLSVTSEPPGAEVTLGKLPKKRTPAEFTGLDKGTTYPLKVALKGNTPSPETPKEITWAGGDDPQKLELTLSANPKPAPRPPAARKPPKSAEGDGSPPPPKAAKANGPKGTLIISSRPIGKVYVDGKDTGQYTPITPARALPLTAGSHTIKVDDGKGKSATVPVTIVAGQPFRLLGLELQ